MNTEGPIETNELECVILKKDGGLERVRHGKLERGDSLPKIGDGYTIGSTGYTVRGHAYTPDLNVTWHLFLQEN